MACVHGAFEASTGSPSKWRRRPPSGDRE